MPISSHRKTHIRCRMVDMPIARPMQHLNHCHAFQHQRPLFRVRCAPKTHVPSPSRHPCSRIILRNSAIRNCSRTKNNNSSTTDRPTCRLKKDRSLSKIAATFSNWNHHFSKSHSTHHQWHVWIMMKSRLDYFWKWNEVDRSAMTRDISTTVPSSRPSFMPVVDEPAAFEVWQSNLDRESAWESARCSCGQQTSRESFIRFY